MPEPFLYSIVVLGVLAFMLWFALGTRANIAKGNRILESLQEGLPRLGERTKLRWLGSSAVQLDIIDPKPPYAEAQLTVVLEPRDLGWLWAWTRSRGRRDLLIMRGRLRAAPGFELEAGAADGWTAQDRLKQLDPATWIPAKWGDEVDVLHSGVAELAPVRESWDAFGRAGTRVWRMSVRREHPHVEVHVALPDTEALTANELITSFIALGSSVVRQR